ncbi:methyltransferase [Actinocrispum wychmicini]|uniref:Ubiquinone/menaquinone biosynthesis C-methylase UbiE n=1 Tax=Actinocrispum wychmicini TaxID=1213861 RepID=A0A4R2K3U3_9PSEU|nr:methyltransferase [Actinocrispum wychmicini]TCO64449.1 ubiquinone/menaquinone biosynthesis C-methylase UbiE [Actinocrispum wychmicini]
MTIDQPGDVIALVNSASGVDLFISVVSDFDLFTKLAGRAGTVAEVAELLEIDERAADVSLTYLTALGLLERLPGGSVRPTPAAAAYLTEGAELDVRAYAAAQKGRPGCRDAAQVLRTGKPAPWESADDGGDWLARMSSTGGFATVFSAAMDARGRYLGPALGDALRDLRPQRVLDVGGSSGIYACSLVEVLPETTAAVLDMPSVVDFSRSSIAARGLADRVDVIAGDMFAELPTGFDVHLFSNVLHDWSSADIERLAAASFAALPPGGVLVDHDMHIDDDKTGPLRQAEFSVRMMLMTAGRCYSAAELTEIFRTVGFAEVTHKPTTAGYSVVVARKPA